ncbi:MAG: Asp-tRNA(Asn)/Glu-tRNA(Gln) amidotransferase subunit GatB [Patescibacteria group bacterium]|nr:Asp-tRNA(Asn)/Glu-tRNA(Gln) amidotransferase subunit GatB [Patescibacteria group bacterium]
MEYETTIGLEIHIELNTRSKMFCSCPNDSSEKTPNANVCPVCLGYPGTLPVINKTAVMKVIKTGLALNCQIAENSFFERKNYFYPDLAKGYQISQYQTPLCSGGYLDIKTRDENDARNFQAKKIKIERIHLEEDTGSLIHPQGTDYSLVNFNRSGVPLMELVSEPDIHSSQEAREFIKELQLILRYLNVSAADMEKGEMRAEVNISLRPQTDKSQKLGTKVEIKNLNSIKAVEKSIDYEIKRQAEILQKGEKIAQETRGWHDAKEITFSQREKESAHDYRYFPEPDLPPLKISREIINEIKSEIGELPGQKRVRLNDEYGLAEKEIELFVNQRDLGEYFEKVVSELKIWEKEKERNLTPEHWQQLVKLASNYIATDLQALLKEKGIAVFDEGKFKISPENFAEFLTLLFSGEISSKIAKMVMGEMFHKGRDPSRIIEENNWQMVSNESEISSIVKKIIKENPKATDDLKKGKKTSLQFLIGQAMAKTKGKANPDVLKNLIEKEISVS